MKLFTILALILFIGCEESKDSSANEGIASISPEPSTLIVDSSVQVKNLDIIDGSYKSECLDSSYYMIYIANYEVEITKFNTNENCEQIKSFSTATYNVSGNDLDYVETKHTYLANSGGSYACGQSHMTSGDAFNIDGIGCSESFENVQNVLSMNDNDQYVVNGVAFNTL